MSFLKNEGLDEALAYVREEDTLVVWRLDRLGRSLKHLIETIKALEERGIDFQRITESIDTTTPRGKLIFHVFGALAEFECDLIREWTMTSLRAARERSRKGGNKRAAILDTEKKVAMAQQLYDDTRNSIEDICKTLRVSPATLYRYIKAGKRGEKSQG